MKNKKLEKYFKKTILPIFNEMDKEKPLDLTDEFLCSFIKKTTETFTQLERPKVKDMNGRNGRKNVSTNKINKKNITSVPKELWGDFFNIYTGDSLEVLSEEEQKLWEKGKAHISQKTKNMLLYNVPPIWLADENKSFQWNMNGYLTHLINEHNAQVEDELTYATKEEISQYRGEIFELLSYYASVISKKNKINLEDEFKNIKINGENIFHYIDYFNSGRGSALSPFLFRKFLVKYEVKYRSNKNYYKWLCC